MTTAAQHRGYQNYQDGVSAEDIVARAYCEVGASLLEKRWRGQSGELDLIFLDHSDDTILFVEVKKARDFSTAVERITQKKVARVAATAEEYMAKHAQDRPGYMRVDAALVDGKGGVEILENITL